MPRLLLLAPIALVALLSGCASTAPNPALNTPEPQKSAVQGPALHGQLLGTHAGSDVELALLVVDQRGRPTATLSSITLRATGSHLPFALPLPSRSAAANGGRIELRARASQAGRLVQRLPHLRIDSLAEQQLGPLQLVAAP